MNTENTDYLDMSEAEFAKLPVPSFAADLEEETGVSDDTDTAEDTDEDEAIADAQPADDSEEEITESDEETAEADVAEEKVTNTEEEPEKTESAAIDYEAEYAKLMAPFKANGKEITPKSPEDLVRLAQMGANYHAKMAAMKPNKKALKTLENNGLLDQDKLAFLIDVSKGKPEAIAKLIKEHNIDPLDVDLDQSEQYKPSDYSVSDAELALDSVLDAISASPKRESTIDVITKQWDDQSRENAAANPHIIKVINEHMENGIYDVVQQEVDYQRSIGKMVSVSDLEAYKLAGEQLELAGRLPGVPRPMGKAPVTAPIDSRASQAKEKARIAKKKAAKPTQTRPGNSLPANINPLNMTEEEFKKFDPRTIGVSL